ncbi:MAG: CotH kinase family protein, partial [Ilumatobacteraceae bacterium]
MGGAPVLNTEDYVDAAIRVVAPNGTPELEMATRVRGRGNSTWGLPKKPYRLRLESSASVAGMPADRDWALLAHYVDPTLVRTRLAMDLGDDLGVVYTPRSEFVELFFNGVYQGVYELYEHVEVAAHKIDVTQLDPDVDAAPDVITGGYHLEVDDYLDEDVCWGTTTNVPICSKDPELDPAAVADPAHPSAAQYAYITNYINQAEAAIFTPGNSYADFFDVDAMVDWYLVSELVRNPDSRVLSLDTDGATSSVHMHKDRGGKLVFGPLWDFDQSAGGLDPTGW